MLCLVRQEEDLVLNALLNREPVQAYANRSNVFIDSSVADHMRSHILDQLQFADCVPSKSNEKTIIQVQLRGHKGMDQLLARVPVQEPDLIFCQCY